MRKRNHKRFIIISFLFIILGSSFLAIQINNYNSYKRETDYNESRKPISNDLTNTSIIIEDYYENIRYYTQRDQKIEFYFKDIDNNLPIKNLNSSYIKVYDQNYNSWGNNHGSTNWTISSGKNWLYVLNLKINGYLPGDYKAIFNITMPNYESCEESITFSITANNTIMEDLKYLDSGGELFYNTTSRRYRFYLDNNLT